MRTAIFTIKENTPLAIETTELALLEQMGHEAAPVKLQVGLNRVIVGAGVFRILSTKTVRVSADAKVEVSFNDDDKDGDWPDPRRVAAIVSPEALAAFFRVAKSQPAPKHQPAPQ